MKVAIIGFGVVGSGVAEVLRDCGDAIAARCGFPVTVGKIVDLRAPQGEWRPYWTTDFEEVLRDPEIGVVCEAIGGLHPAYEYTLTALKSGQHVVSSNKELVASCGAELLQTAKENGVSYLFEASVGGGIPLLGPIARFLSAEEITHLTGILNGTTNFIMTRMEEDGMSFAEALSLAQKNGYAEADPTADIEGIDACRKTAILASLLSKQTVLPQQVLTEGITRLTAADFSAAKAAGFAVKLLCRVQKTEKGISAAVSPALLPLSSPLAAVRDVFNAVLIHGTHLGDAMFYGRGAGKLPTANAVVSDVVEALSAGNHIPLFDWEKISAPVCSAQGEETVWLLRCSVEDAEALAELFGATETYAANGECVLLTMPLSAERAALLCKEGEKRGALVRSHLRVISCGRKE